MRRLALELMGLIFALGVINAAFFGYLLTKEYFSKKITYITVVIVLMDAIFGMVTGSILTLHFINA